MILTIGLSIMMMAGLFLMLWGGVGFLQDKRFFSSAPKEELDVIPDKLPERFKGQHAVGLRLLMLLSLQSSSSREAHSVTFRVSKLPLEHLNAVRAS